MAMAGRGRRLLSIDNGRKLHHRYLCSPEMGEIVRKLI